MSECDNPDEHCETSRVREEKAMGDVQEHTEDNSHHENPSPECPRQEADGAPESFDDESSPTDTPSSDSVEITENCESLDNTTMQESNGAESIEALAEDCTVSSESSDDALIPPVRARDPCRCEMCRVKRRILMEEMERALRLNSLWTDLRKHIHSVFHAAMAASSAPPYSPSASTDSSRQSNLQNTVIQLCKSDPHQFSMRLISQAQEFVVEVKVQLLTLLHNQRINHLAEIFLTRMLDGYDALISTALQISELVKPVETEYFQKFNLTWKSFNKKLYQDYVYTDPLIQNKLPPFIGQLRKLLPLKGMEYQGLVHRYLAFDDEMTRIVNLWPEAVQLIDKHNMEQAARIAKLRRFREGWETFTTWWKQVQQQETYKRHERLQEANNQLEKESQEGVSTTGPNGRVPSPVCLLDTLSIPPKHDIAQFLLDAKTSHQRLVDVLKSIIVSKDHLTVKDYGINMPNHPNLNDLEFQCGYECASTLIQSFATLIANRRNKDKCSENHSDSSLVIDEENCTYCTLSPLLNSNLFMVKEFSMGEESSPTKDKLFPPFNNDIAEMAKRIASNFSAIKDLYNQVSSAMPCDCPEVLNPQTERTKSSLNAIEPTPMMECETASAQPKENRPNCVAEDVDFRRLDFQSCPCVYQHTKDIADKRKEVDNPPCPCLLNSKRKLDTCPCLKKTWVSAPVDVTSNGHSEVQPSAVPHPKPDQEPTKPVMKTSSMNSAQIQTRHSTTQTRSTPHHHNRTARQGSTHSQVVKTAGSAHKAHNHDSQSSGACHKQHVVEHIKRVSCSDLSPGDGDCSDSGSSHEDSCSTSSSSPRDSNRHCDCCYCEVFGHGVPSVAPVSRNYNEMRDRLRQLLTKKKATKCKAACSPPKSPAESLPSNANSDSKTTTSSHSAPRSNTPLSTASTVLLDNRDQRDLDALLEFIEGGQNGKRDNKKAEKKARQKQRKLEDKLKQERLEEERQKLIEIQKKTPEVTITVVDPQRLMPQRLQSHRNLPEVSILPASPSIVLTSLKQCNIKNKKKDKCETPSSVSVSTKNNAKTKGAAYTNQKTKGSVFASVDRVDGVVSSNQGSKNSIKTEKGSNNKVNKAQASNASAKKSGKATAPPPVPPPPPAAVAIDESLLTKKERKKLRREMRKMEEAKVETDNQLQIVTIKRVMESNNAEPTVTITLKGQTPAEDKVLFTLVNGQTKEPNKSDQGQNAGGKKKKNKGKNSNNSNNINNNNNNSSGKDNTSNQVQQNNKLQQPNVKQQQQAKSNDCKNVKQQTGNEKTKGGKQVEPLKLQQQTLVETKNTKSKKDKKNTENKENVSQQQNTSSKSKNQQQIQQQNLTSKKQNKVNSSSQIPSAQKQSNLNNEVVDKKTKAQQQNKNNQMNAKKNNKNVNNNSNNSDNNNKSNMNKTDTQKNQTKVNQNAASKQRPVVDIQNSVNERVSPPFSSQFKDISASSKINIENLKLPPGITITKVDTPARPLPIKSTLKPKPPSPPKQTTIIAAPMNSAQSGYVNQQNGGNVIVVDTGKLKQDLMPKLTDKDSSKENQSGKKKKKKKNKNAANQNGPSSSNVLISQNNDPHDESASILHNPQTNMVTIRNPAFGPPKMEPASQQAAIIKVSENGMVTIRSPALQQAINAGLTPPPKPDFIVKGDVIAGKPNTSNSNPKHTNGIIPSSLAELRSRLTPDCTSLSDLANIQISKVTNGQPIPENGINIKGTSVTLTKVRNPDPMIDEVQQAKTAVREAINASMAVSSSSSSSKGKKKKKRGNGARQSGDDWNLVESVFTPKDIDLEDGDMDDAERELEAFKRFCLQSVPPPRKEKVNLNIKDIVLKKKSSSSTTAAAAVIAAN